MDDEKLFQESYELRELAEKIIVKRRELHWLVEADIVPLIGYVKAAENKKPNKGRVPFADCRKVSGPVKAFCPYEMLITVYPKAYDILNDNQFKIMMFHELKHVGEGRDGLTVNPHNTEDFYSILAEFGIDWTHYNNENLPDILAEEGEKDDKEKPKQKKK